MRIRKKRCRFAARNAVPAVLLWAQESPRPRGSCSLSTSVQRNTRTDFHDQRLQGKAGFQLVLKAKQEDISSSGTGLNACP
jgi:hypothetical protein